MAHTTSGVTEADVIRYVGVVMALLGALVASWPGIPLIAVSLQRKLIAVVAVVFAFWIWLSDKWQHRVHNHVIARAGVARVEVAAHNTIIHREGIIRRLDESNARADLLAARGLVPVGMGIVLTSFPDALAHHPVIGWLVVGATVAITALIWF